jgi:hypothetical protein
VAGQRSKINFKKRAGIGLKVIDHQRLKVKGKKQRLKVKGHFMKFSVVKI